MADEVWVQEGEGSIISYPIYLVKRLTFTRISSLRQ